MIAFADADGFAVGTEVPFERRCRPAPINPFRGPHAVPGHTILAGLRVILSHAMPYGQLMTCTLDSRRDVFVTVRGLATGQIYRMGDDRVLMHPETLRELRRRIDYGITTR